MTTFDQRDKSFENKFAHDEELSFKVNARRTRLVALWAAKKLGRPESSHEQYARNLVEATATSKDEAVLIEKIQADFKTADLSVSLKEIRVEMERLLQLARSQIMGEKK